MGASIRACARAGLLFVLPTLLFCLGLLEIGLRLVERLPSNTTDGIFEQHGSSYRLRKDFTKLSRTPSFTYTLHTNSCGFRDRAPGTMALGHAPYFAFLGDSITFANGVDYQDSFVGVFGSLASKHGIEVVNLAVGGHRLDDQEELLSELLAAVDQKPTWVVVVFTPQLVATFESRIEVMVKSGYLFEQDRWLVPYLTVTLGNASSAYCFFRDGLRHLESQLFPSTPGAGLEALAHFSRKSPWSQDVVSRRFEARLHELEERIHRAGSRPLYVYVPSSVDLKALELIQAAGRDPAEYDLSRFSRLLRQHCARNDIQLVDLLQPLASLKAQGERMSFVQDPHYDARTNRFIGQHLFATVLGQTSTESIFGSR